MGYQITAHLQTLKRGRSVQSEDLQSNDFGGTSTFIGTAEGFGLFFSSIIYQPGHGLTVRLLKHRSSFDALSSHDDPVAD